MESKSRGEHARQNSFPAQMDHSANLLLGIFLSLQEPVQYIDTNANASNMPRIPLRLPAPGESPIADAIRKRRAPRDLTALDGGSPALNPLMPRC